MTPRTLLSVLSAAGRGPRPLPPVPEGLRRAHAPARGRGPGVRRRPLEGSPSPEERIHPAPSGHGRGTGNPVAQARACQTRPPESPAHAGLLLAGGRLCPHTKLSVPGSARVCRLSHLRSDLVEVSTSPVTAPTLQGQRPDAVSAAGSECRAGVRPRPCDSWAPLLTAVPCHHLKQRAAD